MDGIVTGWLHHIPAQPVLGLAHSRCWTEVSEFGALELGDPLLDDCVPAAVGLDLEDVTGPIGDEGGAVRPRRPTTGPATRA